MADDTPGEGHNSGVAGTQLRSFVERVERLEEEKKGIADDIRDVLNEAGSAGFDKKALRRIVRLRKMDPEKRKAEEDAFDVYASALGIFG